MSEPKVGQVWRNGDDERRVLQLFRPDLPADNVCYEIWTRATGYWQPEVHLCSGSDWHAWAADAQLMNPEDANV